MLWLWNYKYFGWQCIKQDLTAVMRWPFLSSLASTMCLTVDSLFWWYAQFLHNTQYQFVLALHTMHERPLARGPKQVLSTSLNRYVGLPSQLLKLLTMSHLKVLVSELNLCNTSLLGECHVSLVMLCTISMSMLKFGNVATAKAWRLFIYFNFFSIIT